MGDFEPHSKQATKSRATAGPSADDRFGPGVEAKHLAAKVLKADVVNGGTLVTLSKGSAHGVRVSLEGYIKGLYAKFVVHDVKRDTCRVFVDATVDQLTGFRHAIINPHTMPRAPTKPDPATTRVIAVRVEGGRTRIIIPRGSAHGIERGTRGHLVAPNGDRGEPFELDHVTATQGHATIANTVDYVRAHMDVKLELSASPTAAAPVQRRAAGVTSTDDVNATAQAGVAGASSQLPFFDTIQRSFGKHDISNIQSQVGGPATAASEALGARAYATGDKVAFASAPDLHTAAHEAAHTIQQRHGAVGFQGLGVADDEHERHADAVADAVVAGESAEPLLDQVVGGSATSAIQRKPVESNDGVSDAQQHDQLSSPEMSPDRSREPAKVTAPRNHGSYEIKLEWGEGSISGGITATLEVGKAGMPVTNDQLRAFKNTASVQVNGFVRKLETAVLNGETELDVLDGVKISIELNAMNVGVDGANVDSDLLQVTLKLVGDVGHWLKAGKNVTLTIDGRLSIALGGKLAAKLSKFTVAQLEQKMLAREMADVGEVLDKHSKSVEKLEEKLRDKHLLPNVRKQLEDELFEHKRQLSTGAQQMKGLGKRLSATKQRAEAAFRKLEGKLAKQVARAMQRKTIAFVASKLAKFVPVLNALSLIYDLFELVQLIKAFANRSENEGSGEGEEKKGERKDSEGTSGSGEKTEGDRERRPEAEKDAIAEARKQLSPAAQQIIAALTHRGWSQGPELGADEIKMLGALVPADLNPEEVRAVLDVLHADQTKAQTPQEAFVAIEQAVRQVRNQRSTVKVDGTSRPDLASGPGADDEGPITSPSQVENDGPIKSPSQIDGGDRDGQGKSIAEAHAIVLYFPAHIAGRWFDASSGTLALNATGAQWIAQHTGATLDAGLTLQSVTHHVQDNGEESWHLSVTFHTITQSRSIPRLHRFMVHRGPLRVGAKVGGLAFEPYVVM